MISRIWHGWTSKANAAAYEALLRNDILPGIQNRRIPGYRGVDLLRTDTNDQVEFLTILWFDSYDAIREFAGEDYEKAVVPARAQALLSRYDSHSQHYDVVVALEL
ncbi:MAG: antibiotic biosynthesis monooxygenase [Candidatus Zixiibacteriota bacterium]